MTQQPATEPSAIEPPATEVELAPEAPPFAPPPPSPSVATTRKLLGASFDLLARSSDDMRRASFYVGIVVLGTVGPFALASWMAEVIGIHRTRAQMEAQLGGAGDVWFGLLAVLAGIGLAVAFVESRTMAVSLLGGHQAKRPITVREALARSRMVFWRAIVASFIVAFPLLIAEGLLNDAMTSILGTQTDVSLVSATLIVAVVGAPFAYLLSGIVLGDVDPFEATNRSFRVFRARKTAAALVAVFESIAALLVVFGLFAGLDIALRVFDAMGLGADSGPAGLTLVTIGIVAGVFALGTLIYTALAISLAPQVVMFVGLTHATMGLDHVRPGGDRDPGTAQGGRPPFRWLTRPVLLGILLGVIGLVALLASLSG